MRIPAPPPSRDELAAEVIQSGQSRLVELVLEASRRGLPFDPYLPWETLRHKEPPTGLTTREWWFVTKLRRQTIQRELPLTDDNGRPFTYALTDDVLRSIEQINRDLSGHIGLGERVASAANRDAYLVSSLIEEAITSSQLEGASTTRAAAKQMIRSGRPPTSRDERMIFNNYRAMQRVGELRGDSLTPKLLCEIQRIVTEGTLGNPGSAGCFQLPGDERVGVYDDTGRQLYSPPPAADIERYVADLCDFVNGVSDSSVYLPPVIRAIVAHFMVGYIHPFEDGNGRTARAVFYWLMLRQGYWLTEFISISRSLRKAPTRYAHSYLHSEQDENDLTYFILYQLSVLQRAIADLHDYLDRKVTEAREFQRKAALIPGEFNHRQIALLQNALRKPNAEYTVNTHANFHQIVRQTARQDLFGLEGRGLLQRHDVGRLFVWRPPPDLETRLRSL